MDDNQDEIPRTYVEGDQHHSGVYRSLDPMQIELLKRLDRLDRVERTTDHMDREVAGLAASRRFWGWAAGIGIPALIAGAFALLMWSHDQVATSSERVGRTEARLDSAFKLIDLLIADVAELRRHAGLDRHDVTDGRIGANP